MSTDKSKGGEIEYLEMKNATVSESYEKERNLDSIEDTKPGPFVWLCATATAIGGSLFGYDTGVISGVLVVLGNDLNGRPVTILFTIGAVVQAASYSIAQMCVGRFLIGLGVGSAAMVIPLYIAEISPAKYRGRMISIDMIFLGTGSVLAYAFAAAFYKVTHGWRYMIGLGAIPSIALGVFLFFCPESPRQLMAHGKREECIAVLRKIYPQGTEEQIADKVLSIENGVNAAKALNEEVSSRKAVKYLFTIPANFRALVAACGLMFFQQFCGFNTLMYYSATLFDIVGFSNPIAVGNVVAVVNWIFTVLSIFIIDRVGRRPAACFHYIPLDLKTLQLTDDKIGWPAYVVLVSMILFVAFYAAGLGCVPWQANEFLPMEVRAMGTTFINVFNWGPNIVVSSTFLSMMKGMTPSGTFGFYAALCTAGLVFVYFCFPEASNMTLEEVREVFQHGFGVKYAEEWRKQYKADQKAMKEHAASGAV
ncbi:myo-inositol transporter [Aureobasidium pullulans]|nr:myo-inositol transporter [Aureobasidium pullulans]